MGVCVCLCLAGWCRLPNMSRQTRPETMRCGALARKRKVVHQKWRMLANVHSCKCRNGPNVFTWCTIPADLGCFQVLVNQVFGRIKCTKRPARRVVCGEPFCCKIKHMYFFFAVGPSKKSPTVGGWCPGRAVTTPARPR